RIGPAPGRALRRAIWHAPRLYRKRGAHGVVDRLGPIPRDLWVPARIARSDDRLDRGLGCRRRRHAQQTDALRSSRWGILMSPLGPELAAHLGRGTVIPAHPLALTANRKLDERRQVALTRYYVAAGAGGVAVGVHSTQFEIRAPQHGLLRPVLELASITID